MKKNEFEHVYNLEVQRYLLSCLIDDADVFVRCRTIVRDEYFDDQLRRGVRFILNHVDENADIPNHALIAAKTGIKLDRLSDYGTALDKDWFFKEIENFCRYKALENVVLEGYDLLKKGEDAQIEKRVKEAMTISLMSDLGTMYFRDPQIRLERLLDKSSMVSTGWQILDDKLYGGFSRGGLNVFCGGSGSGKSLVLQNLALNWALAGYVVIYFTLELSEELVSLRLDSMLTGKSTKEVFKSIADTALLVTVRGKGAGTLAVKKMPEGGTNTNSLRAYLKEFQIKTGLKPDCIVVDYLDMMYPNNDKIDVSSLFVKDKYVSEELRGLMHETNTFGATASQLNRQSIEAQGEFDHSHIAGGISKINTADNVIAINAPSFMKEKGEYELMFLKTRSSSSVGQRIKLRYDTLSMRISDPMAQFNTDIERPIPYDELKKQEEEINEATRELEDWMKTYHSTDDQAEKDYIANLLLEQAEGNPVFKQVCQKRDDYARIIFAERNQLEGNPMSRYLELMAQSRTSDPL